MKISKKQLQNIINEELKSMFFEELRHVDSIKSFINEADYTVKAGDNLIKIARANNLTLQQLLDLNPQYKNNPNLIKVGQTIKLSQEEDEGELDPTDVLTELEYEVQKLFGEYYSSENNFKNNLRDCVAYRNLLEENKFDTPKRKKETEQTLVKTWYYSCLTPFVRDQINEKLKKGHFSTSMEALGYDRNKFIKTLKDMSAASLKYVTDFTFPGGKVFDATKNLEDITDEMESIKRKVAVEARTYLNKPIKDVRFVRGTTMSDILARYSQVTARKS